jgi:hypothetical protein
MGIGYSLFRVMDQLSDNISVFQCPALELISIIEAHCGVYLHANLSSSVLAISQSDQGTTPATMKLCTFPAYVVQRGS